METKNFIDVKDRKYYVKKSMGACSAVLELIKNMLLLKSKDFNVDYTPVEKVIKASKKEDIKILKGNPEWDKVTFTLNSTGEKRCLYIVLNTIGEGLDKVAIPSLTEEITTKDGLKTVETVLKFFKNELGESEIDLQKWEDSKYFRGKVINFVEDYFPKTFGPKAAVKIDSLEFKEAPKHTDKERKYFRKHAGKIILNKEGKE